MNWQRLKEPSFLTAAVSCVLLIVVLFSRGGSPSSAEIDNLKTQVAELNAMLEGIDHSISSAGAGNAANTAPQPQQSDEFSEAVSLADAHLKKRDFVLAFDMILVASRIAPSDPRLFALVMTFAEKAKDGENDEAVALAEDLLDRADSLVHFQSPKDVQSSRRRLTEVREGFSKPSPQPASSSAFTSARTLLVVAENASVPLNVRSKAAEQARNALDDVLLDLTVSSSGQADKLQSDEWRQLQLRTEQAEKQCITELFQQSKPNADKWLSNASILHDRSKTILPEAVPDLSKQISESLSQGFDQLQEVMPYSKSGVVGAVELSQRVEKQLKSLQRLKDWLYNQQVLRLIREVESKEGLSLEDKISQLAEVREELLSPYVLRRHNELWEKVFEHLGDEDKKVWAVKLRILRIDE